MKVSVCIPTYNQCQYLEDCLNSVLQQTMPPFEIIVSDDCSTDNTPQILAELSYLYPVIRIIRQPVNIGLTKNSNACMKAASGDFLVRMGSDDLLFPDYIKKLSRLMENFSQAGYAHCNINEIDKDGATVKKRILFRSAVYEPPDKALKEALKGFKVAANILMFKRAALEKIGFINSDFNFGEDYYMATELSANSFGNVFCEEELAAYRVWNDSGNVRIKRKLEEIYGLTAVFKNMIEPAFVQRKWSLQPVKKAKSKFAATQANCLSWKIYKKPEKQALKEALLELSPSILTRLTIQVYKYRLHLIADGFKYITFQLKQSIKLLLTKCKMVFR